MSPQPSTVNTASQLRVQFNAQYAIQNGDSVSIMLPAHITPSDNLSLVSAHGPACSISASSVTRSPNGQTITISGIKVDASSSTSVASEAQKVEEKKEQEPGAEGKREKAQQWEFVLGGVMNGAQATGAVTGLSIVNEKSDGTTRNSTKEAVCMGVNATRGEKCLVFDFGCFNMFARCCSTHAHQALFL